MIVPGLLESPIGYNQPSPGHTHLLVAAVPVPAVGGDVCGGNNEGGSGGSGGLSAGNGILGSGGWGRDNVGIGRCWWGLTGEGIFMSSGDCGAAICVQVGLFPKSDTRCFQYVLSREK